MPKSINPPSTAPTHGSYPMGSIWRKWDLHIHSPLSLLNNQFAKTATAKPDWDAFLEKLESLDLAAVGITDYFTIDGYKTLLQYRSSGRLNNVQLILPNIEFRLANVISSKKDSVNPRRLNLHVIFSDEVRPEDIEEHFLHDLHFYYEGNPQAKDETRKLKLSNIEALGRQLISQHKKFQDGRDPLEIGAMTAVVNHEEITEILTNDSRFKGKYLIVFPEELFNLIDWDGQDHHVRKGVLQKSDMVFSANRKTIAWCLGQPPYQEGQEGFLNEFKTLKPSVHGSDAHNLHMMGAPCARRGESGHTCAGESSGCEMRYCWIKADPTFEGLKQILYEPADRVQIQTLDPSPLKSNYCLEEVSISSVEVNDELRIAETKLPMNQGLVAVAGGRGSGKTALLDLIANCYIYRERSEDPNSFVRRVIDESPGLEVSLRFRDGTLFKKALSEEKIFEESQIVYIAQGELERYIGDDSDLDKYVKDLIFESPQVKNTAKAFEFENQSKKREEIRRRLLSRHASIVDLESRTTKKAESDARTEQKQVEAELKDVSARISELEARLTKEKLEVTRKKQNEIAEMQALKQALMVGNTYLEKALTFVGEELPTFRESIQEVNRVLESLKTGVRLGDLIYEDMEKLTGAKGILQEALEETIGKIEALNKEVKGYEAGMQQHAACLGRKAELAQKLEGIKSRIRRIEEDRRSLEQLRVERRQQFGDLLRTIIEEKTRYEEIISLFSSEKSDVLSDLNFVAEVHWDSDNFFSGAEDILDNRQVEVYGNERESEFRRLDALYRAVVGGAAERIDELVTETERLGNELRGKLKKSRAIDTGSLYRCLYEQYLVVTPLVRYKNTALNKLSLGQKATVLIKIYLAQGTTPIIIDSHDDHLDNEFIMDELVGALRQAKGYRQIILASNNGNVVINSDAEQIVIANREDGKISYCSGAIEDPGIRDRILKVLEGGPDAFRKRQQKYRIVG